MSNGSPPSLVFYRVVSYDKTIWGAGQTLATADPNPQLRSFRETKEDHCVPDRWASSLMMLGGVYRNASLCLTVQGATGGTARILTMGSRKPHSWLLTPMIEGIELNVFWVKSFRGSSGKKKPSTTRVKDLVFWNKNRKIRSCLRSPNLLTPEP